MKISYYETTDSLYIDLQGKPGSDVITINDYINIDIDDNGEPVGIEIYQKASKFVDINSINFENIADIPKVN